MKEKKKNVLTPIIIILLVGVLVTWFPSFIILFSIPDWVDNILGNIFILMMEFIVTYSYQLNLIGIIVVTWIAAFLFERVNVRLRALRIILRCFIVIIPLCLFLDWLLSPMILHRWIFYRKILADLLGR